MYMGLWARVLVSKFILLRLVRYFESRCYLNFLSTFMNFAFSICHMVLLFCSYSLAHCEIFNCTNKIIIIIIIVIIIIIIIIID